MASKSEEKWEVIAEPRSTIEFDTIGDEWEGYYEGTGLVPDPNTGEEYTYLHFRDGAGEAFQMSASYDLTRTFIDGKMPEGTYCRLTLVELKPRPKGNALKLFKVQVRK